MFKTITIFVICIVLGACASMQPRRADRQILEYQRQIDRLEESIRARDRAIETGVRELGNITARSEAMGADISSIIRELDEYQRAVERLLQDYREAGSQSKN